MAKGMILIECENICYKKDKHLLIFVTIFYYAFINDLWRLINVINHRLNEDFLIKNEKNNVNIAMLLCFSDFYENFRKDTILVFVLDINTRPG